jgi:AcrR family transcriptional regulator
MSSVPVVSARTAGASVAPGSPALTDVATRICTAVVEVVADQGLRATSIDDIAVAAGCGRATVYRAFPGGRAELLLTVLDREVAGIFELGTVAVRSCSDFTDAVTAAIHSAAMSLAGHAALQKLLATEPGTILPFISFDGLEPVLAMAADWGRVEFGRFVSADDGEIVGEWAARVLLGHVRSPGTVLDVTDRVAVKRLVESFLLPGLATAPQPSKSITSF